MPSGELILNFHFDPPHFLRANHGGNPLPKLLCIVSPVHSLIISPPLLGTYVYVHGIDDTAVPSTRSCHLKGSPWLLLVPGIPESFEKILAPFIFTVRPSSQSRARANSTCVLIGSSLTRVTAPQDKLHHPKYSFPFPFDSLLWQFPKTFTVVCYCVT